MARKLKSDKLLFTATLVLVCASLVMVYSASAVIGMEQYHQRPAYFLFKQITFALVAVLFGPRLNGARRWFGVAGIGGQPSEFAKLVVVVFVAAILERRMD